MSKRKFTWDSWDYDCDGEAYVIAKSECPNKADLPEWLIKADRLSRDCIPNIASDIKEGWCAYQCRNDWDNYDVPTGAYVVETYEPSIKQLNGKRKPGWFDVWVIRKGEWY